LFSHEQWVDGKLIFRCRGQPAGDAGKALCERMTADRRSKLNFFGSFGFILVMID
jgi:hypothetical protein